MNHADHIFLLRDGIPQPGGTWADFGAGAGAFTLALAELTGPESTIYAVDLRADALARNAAQMTARFPGVTLHTRTGDFTTPLDLPPLDGIVMANALHFVRDKRPALVRIRETLKPGGRLILVEYDTDRGNRWVPHPLSYATWERLAVQAGFTGTRRLAKRPSSFLGSFFSALSAAPDPPR